MTTTKALLIGQRRRLALTMVGGFAGVVALALAVAVVADLADIRTATALTDRLVPLLVFYAPAPIAAAGAYARCGGPACLTVGVVPALVFATLVVAGTVFGVPGVGGGDAPLGGVTMSFALVGLSGAFVGYCAGVTAALLADLAGFGGDGGDGGDGETDAAE
ncbi:hypothetical protein [Halorubrum kocurii]|uniref:Uncharacterized protein n=1 Tax=Halorubrum kocurii JCM 14978 TaxID=1230456 RepID=M0NWC0_9EURY|nr:hypothetical protein [Halorubrum kocurii]EMA61529.1 hypothetical protein C468_12047 [Halorubrum kocurii JCM 14978]